MVRLTLIIVLTTLLLIGLIACLATGSVALALLLLALILVIAGYYSASRNDGNLSMILMGLAVIVLVIDVVYLMYN